MENLLRMPGGNEPQGRTGFSVQIVGSVPLESAVSLSTAQVAGQLGLSELDVLRLIARGELAANNIEGRWHVDAEDLRAVMKSTRRWKVPADLGVVDYAVERKVRERLIEALKAETPDAVVLAAAKRAVRPGLPLESVNVVELAFSSAPRSFVDALAADSRRGEFQPRIKGEQTPAPVSLALAFVKSRLAAALNQYESRELSIKGTLPAHLYSSPSAYKQVVDFAVGKVQNELLTVRETRLVEVESRRVEVGSELQIAVKRVPLVVLYSLPMASLESVLKVGRTASEVL